MLLVPEVQNQKPYVAIIKVLTVFMRYQNFGFYFLYCLSFLDGLSYGIWRTVFLTPFNSAFLILQIPSVFFFFLGER